jgi:hypothetical protein
MVERDEIIAVLKGIYPFREMEDEWVSMVADRGQIVTIPEGETIFNEGDEAHHLYIVLAGDVRQYITFENQQEVLATVHSGDIFGLEAIQTAGVRRTTARALTETSLIDFDEDDLVFLAENVPELDVALEILLDSYFMSLRIRFEWLDENESIYYMAHRHWMFLGKILIPLGLFAVPLLLYLLGLFLATPNILLLILAGLLILISAGVTIWSVIDWLNDYAVITNQRVAFEDRVILFYDTRHEAPLDAIMSVSTETDLIGRVFDYGDVIVRTYTGVIVLPMMADPDQIKAIIQAEWYRARVTRSQAEKMMVDRRVREVLGYPVEGAVAEAVPVPEQVEGESEETSRRPSVWSTLFQSRFEDPGGDITYRKHVWILLDHILWPALAGLGLVIAAVLVGMTTSFIIGLTVFLAGSLIVGPWFIYQYVDWRNDYYQITDEQILDVYKRPLAEEQRQAAPLRNIQSIEYRRTGLISILLDFGTVFIRVGDKELTFDNVSRPAEVQRELFNRLAKREYLDKQVEIGNEQERMAEWFAAYHRYTQGNRGNEPPLRGPF